MGVTRKQIDLPDELANQLAAFAAHVKESQSEIVRKALREYLAKHAYRPTSVFGEAFDEKGDE